jgi:3-deoxy-7-phosphoheptulonate synthase
MILHVDEKMDHEKFQHLVNSLKALYYKKEDYYVVITPASFKETGDLADEHILSRFVTETDIQLAGKNYISSKRKIILGDMILGGASNNTIMMAGPCSVESEEQIEETSVFLKASGIKVLRAGAFKPRTSPYTFQGMGLEGLKLLAKMREKYGFKIITEVRDSTHADEVIDYADIIQIGAKSMYDQGILRKCARIQKPVLLKRFFGATLQEFVQMAEFILSGGNENVILCERGIRTFESKTRFTLDLCGVAYLKEATNLPVVLDPSHAMGYAFGVPDLAKACMAMGVDGLLIEVHPNPKVALSDASQQLDHAQFTDLFTDLKRIAQAVGRNLL